MYEEGDLPMLLDAIESPLVLILDCIQDPHNLGACLRTAGGAEETVPRSQIASLVASGLSLMPDGLEQTMAEADVANLVAFLKSDP